MNSSRDAAVATKPPSRWGRRAGGIALWILGVVAIYGLLFGLALPPLAKKLIAEKAGEKLGRTVTVEDLTFNPFTLAATMKGLRVMEADGRGTFVAFDTLDLDASGASFYRLAPIVDRLTLSGLRVNLVRDGETHFNFSDILERLARASAAKPKEKPGAEEDEPRFSVSNIRLVAARIALDDRPMAAKHEVSAIDLAIPIISSLPAHLKEYVQPAFSAQVNGAAMRVAGETLPFEDSLRTRFTLALDAVDIRRYLGYVPASLPFKVDAGMLDANISVRFTQAAGKQPSIDISGTAALRDFAASTADGALARFARLEADVASFDPLAGKAALRSVALREATALGGEARVPSLEARDIAVDLRKRVATIASLATQDGALALKRNRDGKLVLPAFAAGSGADQARPAATVAVASTAAPATPAAATPATAPWDVTIAKASLANYQLSLDDAAVKPAAAHRVTLASVELEELTTRNGGSGGGRAKLVVGKGGAVDLATTFTLAPLLVDATVDARAVDLVPLRAYVPDFKTVAMSSGNASAKGKATVRGKPDALQVSYRGSAEIANLATTDIAAKEDLLNWKSVRAGGIEFDMGPGTPLTVAVGEILVDRVYSRIVVLPDGKLNVQQLRAATPAQPNSPAPVATETKPRNVRIDRVRFVEGRLNFTDLFIRPNYSADVGELRGSVDGLSSQPQSRAKVDLKGRYDRTSPVVIAGRVNPLAGDLFLDIAAKGSDIELPKLTAYSQRYAGYGITAGKLTLDVKYHIEGGKMQGRNKILVDQLTFGDKVESPEATKLPVLFAVNLLKDSKGQINLELPVSGSLDDPQFEIAGLVTQVLGGLLKKAVTSPFSLLTAVMGGGGSGGGGTAAGGAPDASGDLAFVEFEPGRSELTPAARKKLEALVKALQDRPAIKLELAGHADAKKDAEVLRRAELQRQLAAIRRAELAAAGKPVKPDEPASIDAADHPRYVKALFERDKPSTPAPASQTVKAAAPGEGAKGAPKPPPPPTTAEMEAALLERIAIGDEQLKALSAARAAEAKGFLVAAGRLPGERVLVAAVSDTPSTRVDFALK